MTKSSLTEQEMKDSYLTSYMFSKVYGHTHEEIIKAIKDISHDFKIPMPESRVINIRGKEELVYCVDYNKCDPKYYFSYLYILIPDILNGKKRPKTDWNKWEEYHQINYKEN